MVDGPVEADSPLDDLGVVGRGVAPAADYVTIEGFTVNGMPRAGIRSVLNQFVTIRNNSTDANGTWGIFTGFSDDLLIENHVTTRSVAEHGIYVSNSGDRPVIRGNVSWGNNAAGIHMNGDASMGGDGIISNGVVENNVLYSNGAAGGSAVNADGVLVIGVEFRVFRRFGGGRAYNRRCFHFPAGCPGRHGRYRLFVPPVLLRRPSHHRLDR